MFDDFYGLSGKPFQLTPDPEFYFRSITHRKALSYLGYGLAQGEGFIVITGEVGSGKSTLVAHMMKTLDPDAVTVAQIVTSKLNEEEIVHVVAGAMGLDVEGHDKATALTDIESFLHEEARAGRRCLLIIDESQNLSVQALEELRMFSNFQLGNHPLLQTLLLGQPEFRETLQNDDGLEQLRQRVIAAHHLEPMQEAEIEPYIVHRLEKVGWNGNPSFAEDVFAGIFAASDGIPRRVNQIANRLMLAGAIEKRSDIDSAMLEAVLAEMGSERAVPPAPAVPEAPVNNSGSNTVASGLDREQVNAAILEREAMLIEAFDGAIAERDAQIAELRAKLDDVAERPVDADGETGGTEIGEMREQLARIEARSFEQERSIRQTLTMLIDWIEGEMDSSKAA
ncbi:XrtA/PEP-CTERM system-associated ATPase [Aurantiacibacter aquimixticola]|uniref:General secretion pathway protein n=1 Tax=Aurantiacibacter aquimixticola TaxID=1958945 RepID=A0A419RS21_9SPHN|nr:XrtA/PEP-CTERM system-associated ATPase [Aurantiacibacter aquimixticola]RJY08603.1 general secretion pathway protein [Aurantiacibacter aquimixticola]